MKRISLCLSLGLFTLISAWQPTVARAESFMFGAPEDELVFGSTGYSGVLRGGYMTPLGEGLSIGGEFILDVGVFNGVGDDKPGDITLAAGAPIKLHLVDTPTLIVGATFTPGLGVGFADTVTIDFSGEFTRVEETTEALFALLLHAQVNAGYKVNEKLIVGGGIDFPMTFYFGEFDVYVFPILFGPTAEYQINDQFSVGADLKLGPHIAAGDADSTSFGFKFAAVGTYRF